MREPCVRPGVTPATATVRDPGNVSVGWAGTDLGVTSVTSSWAAVGTATAPRRLSASVDLAGPESSVTSPSVARAVRAPAPGQASVGVAPGGEESCARSAVPGRAVSTVTAQTPGTVTVARAGGARCATSRTAAPPVTRSTDTAASRASVSAGLAGGEISVTPACPTPAVSTVPAARPGTATVRRAGEDLAVTRWRLNCSVTESETAGAARTVSLSA